MSGLGVVYRRLEVVCPGEGFCVRVRGSVSEVRGSVSGRLQVGENESLFKSKFYVLRI